MTEASKTKASTFGRAAAHAAIRAYQLSLSGLVGSHCRHLPTCSAYMDEAIARHGVWGGGWMGLARLCRCQPFGTAGFDPPPRELPVNAHWALPWRYGRWRGPLPDSAAPGLTGANGPDAPDSAKGVNAIDPPDAARPE